MPATSTKCEKVTILSKIDSGAFGYGAQSGRYAAFFLGQYYQSRTKYDKAKQYYALTIDYGDEINAQESGYYLYSCLYLARLYSQDENFEEADQYLETLFKNSKKKHDAHKRGKELRKLLHAHCYDIMRPANELID